MKRAAPEAQALAPGVFVFEEAPRTLTEVIYRRLRSDIVWGVLPPGYPLKSDELRSRYEIGISPLREALTRLVSEKLVTSVGQRGFRVAPIGAQDVIDVTETRLVIEREALVQSIKNGDLRWETALVAALHAFSRVPIPTEPGAVAEEWTKHHKIFHMTLLSACGSIWQMNLASLLFDQAERFRIVRATHVPSTKVTRDTLNEHKHIVDAALDRDPKTAVAALERHYRATSQEVLAVLRAGDEVPAASGTKSVVAAASVSRKNRASLRNGGARR